MILNCWRKWLVTTLLLLPSANLDMSMQMLQMPPGFGFPGPVPAPMAFQIIGIRDASKMMTTSTTERADKTLGIVIPVAFPMPVQFAVPAYPPPNSCAKVPRPVNCPVCPPCSCSPCTPAFFSYCSSCHQKCRCQSARDAPIPLPRTAPVAMQGPAFPMQVAVPAVNSAGLPMVPIHSARRQMSWGVNAYELPESESSESSSRWRRRAHGVKTRHIRRRKSQRNRARLSDMNDNEFARPVLSYITDDGAVHLEEPLSNDEAAELLEENQVQRVDIVSVDGEGGQQVKVVSREGVISQFDKPVEHRRRQLVLNSAHGQHVLAEGNKQLVFNPPSDKRISNLSVSFQIS